MRSRPTPSAPDTEARTASSTLPTLATTSTVRPSVVVAGSWACTWASASASVRTRIRSLASATVSSSGSSTIVPASPSSTAMAPSDTSMWPTPTMAGTPIDRARIAVCDTADPTSVQKASAMPWGRLTVSDGVRSWATMIDGTCTSARPPCSMPSRARTTCWPMSRMSTARWAKYSSPSSANSSASSLAPSSTARSAGMALDSMRSLIGSMSDESSRNMRWTPKISAVSAPALATACSCSRDSLRSTSATASSSRASSACGSSTVPDGSSIADSRWT